MIAGTVIIFKNIAENFAVSMKRGSIILMKEKTKLDGRFQLSGKISTSFYKFLSVYLNEKFSINFKINNFFRFYGDRSANGLGEVIKNSS